MSTGDDSSAPAPRAWDDGGVDAPLTFRERLWPGPLGWTMVLAVAAVLAAATAPIGPGVAVGVGLVSLALGILGAWSTAARVEVRGTELTAGRARIAVRFLGAGAVLDRAQLRAALGPGSDARDYVLLRAWLPGAVSLPVVDPRDATPRWVVSSRRPDALLAAVQAARDQAAHSEQIG